MALGLRFSHAWRKSLIMIHAVLFAAFSLQSAHSGQRQMQNALALTQANVIFMRHALAPGVGDPAEFDISDCKTQRNLNGKGRAQARDIGRVLDQANLDIQKILSSQWCRCLETAQLLDIGPVETFAGLNSFFQNHYDRGRTVSLLKDYIDTKAQGLTLMVTHQVVIRAITGQSVASGQFVAYNSMTGQAQVFALD